MYKSFLPDKKHTNLHVLIEIKNIHVFISLTKPLGFYENTCKKAILPEY